MNDRAFVHRLVLKHAKNKEDVDRRALSLWLYYRLGLEIREVADVLGMPAEIVEKQIARLSLRAEVMSPLPSTPVLVHSCEAAWRDELGRSVLTCRCRKTISRQSANRMVETGEADWREVPRRASKKPTRTSTKEIVLRAAIGKQSRVPGVWQMENLAMTGKISASIGAYSQSA